MQEQYKLIKHEELIDRIDEAILIERNTEIRQIERDVSMIAEIMTDMATLVHVQGEELDVAADQVENATVNVSEAVRHLENSSELQSRFRKWVIGAGVISVGVMVTGGLLAVASLPIGLATMGIGALGGAITVTTATTLK